VDKVKATAYAKFDESVDIAVRLGVDPKHADQIVRGTVSLPHGTGKKIRVLVIAQGDKAKEAEAAGADFVGVEYVQQIKDGWLDTDVIVATPDVMGQLGPLGKVLGPRGLMPNPKAGTVTMDVARAVKELKAGKIEFRVAGVEYVVVKNTLARRALADARVPGLEPHLAGPTGLVLGGADPVVAAKVLGDFAKEFEKPAIKAGLVDGAAVTPDQVKRLATLPSRTELLAQLGRALQAPMAGFVGALNGVLMNFVGALEALRTKRASAGGAAS